MEAPELELIAEHGATVVTNPVSNLKLAVGRVFPYAKVRAHGIPLGLGTDGASSNNSLDVLADLKVLALLQKHATGDPASLPAHEAWPCHGCRCAGAPRRTGRRPRPTPRRMSMFDPRCTLAIRLTSSSPVATRTELAPGHVIDNLVYAASGSVVRTTVVAGRVVMSDGVVEGIDTEEEVRAKVVECARRLGVL